MNKEKTVGCHTGERDIKTVDEAAEFIKQSNEVAEQTPKQQPDIQKVMETEILDI